MLSLSAKTHDLTSQTMTALAVVALTGSTVMCLQLVRYLPQSFLAISV